MGWYYVITEEMRDKALKGFDLLIYAIIAGYSREGAGCFYGSRSLLAERAGCTVKTVDSCLAKLIHDDYIRKAKGLDENGRIVVTYTAVEMGEENFTHREKISQGVGKKFPLEGEKFSHNNKEENKDKNKSIPPFSKENTPHFVKPLIDDVRAYCQERQNNVSPEAFFAYYESNGWKVGRNPMKDWRAAVRTWEQRDQQNPSPRSARPSPQKEDYVQKGLRMLKQLHETGSLL